MRNVAFAAISILIGLVVPLGVAEIALRFLPVSEGLRAVAVNDANPVFHFTPGREVTWSRGWRFDLANRVRVNNAGYVNDQDYVADDARPLLAVVGDSYVEAAMVPYRQTLHGRLADMAGPRLRVYSFAASGAPLSQYLAWAREARMRWKARALVVVVVGNDFDESLARYRSAPGFHHYAEAADGSLALRRFDYSPSAARLAVQRSALAKYLLLNLQLQERLPRLMDAVSAAAWPAAVKEHVGNTAADASRDRLERSRAAVRAFLADLVGYAGWRPDEVVLVVDGIRYPAKAGMLAESYFGQMRSYLLAKARHAGFEAIDMDPRFFARFEAGAAAFEFANDGHWNGLAHGLAAEAVAASAAFARWRDRP